MAAKATIQDVTDAGFRAAQFGTPADWETADTGYVARLLARASLWAQGEFGAAAYAAIATGTTQFEHLRSAELCWVSHHLWKRRAAFIDSNAASSLDRLAHADRKQYLEAAASAWECALSAIALAVGDRTPGSAVVLTHVVSGPFQTRRAGACG